MPTIPSIHGSKPIQNRANVGSAAGQVLNVALAEKSMGPELRQLANNLNNTGTLIDNYAKSKLITDSQSWVERGKIQSRRLNANRMHEFQSSGRTETKEQSDTYNFVKDKDGLSQSDKDGLKQSGIPENEYDSHGARMFLNGFRILNSKNYAQTLQANAANAKFNALQSLATNKAEALQNVNVENLDDAIDTNSNLLRIQELNFSEKVKLQERFVIDATNKSIDDAMETQKASIQSGSLEDKLQDIDDIGESYKKYIATRISKHYKLKDIQAKKVAIDSWKEKAKKREIDKHNRIKNQVKEDKEKALSFLQAEGNTQFFNKNNPEELLESVRANTFVESDIPIEGLVNQANDKTSQVNPAQFQYEKEKEIQSRLIYNIPLAIINGKASVSPEDIKSLPPELHDDLDSFVNHDPVMSDEHLKKLFQSGSVDDQKKLKEYYHYFESDGKPNFRYKNFYSFMKGSGRAADLREALREGSSSSIKVGDRIIGRAIAHVENGADFGKMQVHLRSALDNGLINNTQYKSFKNSFKTDKKGGAKIDSGLKTDHNKAVKSLFGHLDNRLSSDEGYNWGTNPLTGKPFMVDPEGKKIQQEAKDFINDSASELLYELRGKTYEEGKVLIDNFKRDFKKHIENGVLNEKIQLMSDKTLNKGYTKVKTKHDTLRYTYQKYDARTLLGIWKDNKDTMEGNVARQMFLEIQERIKEKENVRNTTASK